MKKCKNSTWDLRIKAVNRNGTNIKLGKNILYKFKKWGERETLGFTGEMQKQREPQKSDDEMRE